MPQFEITAFGRPEFKSRRLAGRLLNLVKRYGKRINADLGQITYTWEHKPGFEQELHYAGGLLFVRVSTDDPIFGYLDEGTSIRWAVMTKDFVPKTRIRTIASFPGSGHVAIRGKGAMTKRGIAPRPGITAREWTQLMIEIHEPSFQVDATQIILEEFGAFL